MNNNTTYFSFGDNFEEKFAKEMTKNPDIAITELVSNSRDAAATEVFINWPVADKRDFLFNETFTIKDNGIGMTEEEFRNNWSKLGFNKRENQGFEIEIVEGINRKIIGRNGKGRLGLFGFADNYIVITCKNKEINKFKVSKTNKPGNYAEITKISLNAEEQKIFNPKKETGTYIKCNINENYIEIDNLISVISTRFGADPYFKLYINNNEIKLLDLEKYDKKEYEFEKDKNIQIVQIPRERYNKKFSQYQIVWWVKQRAVEHNSWKQMKIPLDGKNPDHNKYVFCIICDFLEDYVKTDWTGFEKNKEVNNVKLFVKNHLSNIVKEFFKESSLKKKVEAVEKSKKEFKIMNPLGRKEIGSTIDQILERCPNIDENVLDNVVNILAQMEISNRKYDLLETLSSLHPTEYDKLTEILETWSVRDANLVLNELYNRLTIIAKLEKFSDNPNANELHMIHPLFESGLWMFGPQYEGIGNFTSNKSLKTGLKKILNVDKNFKESSRRPDLLTTSNQDIWDIYGSNKYDEDKIVGYRKILLIELKKGNSKISYDEMDQARKYVKKIKAHGKIQKYTKVDCYVIGSRIDPENNDEEKVGEYGILYPTTFDTIIRNAKKRTLDLKDKLIEVKGITDIIDKDIETIISEDIKDTAQQALDL